jgi:hypothetical protein
MSGATIPPPQTSKPSTMHEAAGRDDLGDGVEGQGPTGLEGEFAHLMAADEHLVVVAGDRGQVEASITFSMLSISHSASWVASLMRRFAPRERVAPHPKHPGLETGSVRRAAGPHARPWRRVRRRSARSG